MSVSLTASAFVDAAPGTGGNVRDEVWVQQRVAFLLELAQRLHQYGTSSPRLELVISKAAEHLGLGVEVWSSPTAIITSFRPYGTDAEAPASTRLMRLPPGEVHLGRLCAVDQVVEQVTSGKLDLKTGLVRLQALGVPAGPRAQWAEVASYGLAAASVTALLQHKGWADMLVAGIGGLIIGVLTVRSAGNARLVAASEALSAMIATLLAIIVSAYIVPLTVKSVVMASLVVLLPGMALTTAVREIASQHLVAGVARMGGALATLLKLTFGTVAAAELCAALGIHARAEHGTLPPPWLDLPALLLAAFAFAILFRAARRDWWVVMGAVVLGYCSTRLGGLIGGPIPAGPLGVFLGGLGLGALANLYVRLADRPGMLIREPGIVLLVPGGAGFSSMSALFQQDQSLGLNTGLLLFILLMNLVAGLLFGDLLITPRSNRNL